MAETKIKAAQFHGVVGHGTDGYFLMTNADGSMSWAEGGASGPSVTSVDYPGDDTAADPAGGQTVVLTGTNFGSSMTVSIGGTTAPSVAHDSSTQLTITTPAKAAGDYDIVVTNTVTGASGTFVNGISYNGIPTWTTAAGSLGTFESETTISTITLQATEPDGGTITFNITNGALPTGLSLTGANIDGTTTAESSTTLYSFTIEAIDDENQATPRNFSITVNAAEIVPSQNFTINTYTGNGSTQSIEGKIDTAGSFNGSSSKIVLPTSTFSPSAFTLSAWCNVSSDTSENTILELFDNQTYPNYTTIVLSAGSTSTSARFLLRNYTTNEYNYNPSGTVTKNVWKHYAMTYDGSTVKSYIDGSLVDSASFTLSNPVGTISSIQLGLSSGDRYLNGKIDQVRIFNRALDETTNGEVTTLYGENNASSTKSTTDIFDDGSGVALYEFEEGAKDTGGVNGYIGAAGVFNGSSSRITTNLITPNTQDLSWSFWVKDLVHNGSSSTNTLLLDYKNNYAFINYTSSNTLYANARSSSTNANIDVESSAIDTSSWRHIVFVSSLSSGSFLYIDGALVDSNTASMPSRLSINYGSGLEIGWNPAEGSPFTSYALDGKIDQVRIFNKELSSSEVTTLYQETSASSTKSTTDIFDDGSGVALYELEGNANDTPRGAIDAGQSAVFNGSNSNLQLNQNPATSALTFSAWVYFNNFTNSYNVIGNITGTVYAVGWSLQLQTNGKFILLTDNDTSASWQMAKEYNNSPLNANQWYHIALVSNGAANNLYIDGTEITNVTYVLGSQVALNNGSNNLQISYGGSSRVLNGKLDQVRIYSSALSASDVEALASETNVPTANLVAHYKLDGNANDETGSYNGTASNVTYSDPAEFPTYNGTATNVTYAYNGTPTNVSFVGTSFQPDLVWIKDRDINYSHQLYDSVRGATKKMLSNSTAAESTDSTALTAFDSNGFTISTNVGINTNNNNYAAWCWKAADTTTTISAGTVGNTIASDVRANQDAGFSIVKYTANATSGATIGHGLDQELDLLIVKSTNLGQAWNVYVKDVTDTSSKYLRLNESFSISDLITANSRFIPNNFTDSVFSVGNDNSTNGISGTDTYIAYCFHSVDSYQKVGSYSGTGSAGNAVTTGFQPRFVMIKSSSNAEPWFILDAARDTSNPRDNRLMADSSAAEDDGSVHTVDFTSTGFTANGTVGNGTNGNGVTYIYLAIA